jgi:hypothetical protein
VRVLTDRVSFATEHLSEGPRSLCLHAAGRRHASTQYYISYGLLTGLKQLPALCLLLVPHYHDCLGVTPVLRNTRSRVDAVGLTPRKLPKIVLDNNFCHCPPRLIEIEHLLRQHRYSGCISTTLLGPASYSNVSNLECRIKNSKAPRNVAQKIARFLAAFSEIRRHRLELVQHYNFCALQETGKIA